MKKSFLLFLFITIVITGAYSQDTIVTVKDARLVCKVLREDDEKLYFRMDRNGETINTFINKSEVKSVSFYKPAPKKEKPRKDSIVFNRKTVFYLDILTPALGLETEMSDKASFLLYYQPGIIFLKEDNEATKSYFVNQFKGGLRFYNKSDNNNNIRPSMTKFSGSFVSIPVYIYPESYATPAGIALGTTFGMQKNWGSHGHFSVEFGGGIKSSTDVAMRFTFIADLKLGFSF